ncbi:MAG: amino acid ABC transporter permease [Solirubrobacteraceae bacterium]
MSASELSESRTDRPEDIRAVPVRHPGRWLAAVIVLIIAAAIVRSIVTNKHFGWHYVGQYLFDSRVLHGMLITIILTVVSMAVGIIVGIVLAIMRMSPNPIVSGASWLYIWFFRGTPLLVQIIFWFNIAALFPGPPQGHGIGFGIPFGPDFVHYTNINSLITAFVAALLALSVNEGAYMSEIVRAGFISVPEGQTEAAQSLGLSRLQTLRRIVLPQAMRVIIPPTGNETISMLKNTSLISVVGYAELLYASQEIYDVNYQVIPLLIVASIWYLVLTSILYVIQYFIERRYGRGFSRSQRASMRERWLGLGRGELAGPSL